MEKVKCKKCNSMLGFKTEQGALFLGSKVAHVQRMNDNEIVKCRQCSTWNEFYFVNGEICSKINNELRVKQILRYNL